LKKRSALGAFLLLTAPAVAVPPDDPPPWDTAGDTWVATDALGRKLPGFDECGPPRADRTVGIFYFLWLGAHVNGGPHDITKILARDPGSLQKKDSPLWGPLHAPHHWGESVFGYYLTDDAGVLRKHAQMLSDAGVDAVYFDVTNQFTYKPYYLALLKVFSEVRKAGGRPPRVAFLCPFWDPSRVVPELFHDLYEPGLHSDLWFRWEGKPLILADPALLKEGEGNARQDTPAALEPGRTLGQSFTVEKAFGSVGGCFPTWKAAGSAMTLSLHRNGPGGERLSTRRFEKVEDNAWLSLELKPALPPGTYYLEMSAAAGKVGWWSHSKDVYPQGQAFADGAPAVGDRTLRIGTDDRLAARMRDFFTFRKPQPDYFRGPTQPDMWSWLEVYPQHVFQDSKGRKEQMSVGVAQNAVGNRLGCLSEAGARGRSFHRGADDPAPDAVLRGLNFAEQWERALKEDPRLVFVTGWNEWIAGRFDEFNGVRLPVMFVDQFDQEHSRDIEPMKGGHGDAYYYQLVSYIRRYKGVRKPPPPCTARAIRPEDGFAPWKEVVPEYRDDVGDPVRRDHPGYNNGARYVNRTGRNDLVAAKVAGDDRTLSFYARTKDPITPPSDSGWMMLFIDADADPGTGWLGYDFVLNRSAPGPKTAVLEKNSGNAYRWERVAEVEVRVSGNEMMATVPREKLGLKPGPAVLDFKWADNLQQTGEASDFTLNGDAAPNDRFNYRVRLGPR
jgi:hypothetical protein